VRRRHLPALIATAALGLPGLAAPAVLPADIPSSGDGLPAVTLTGVIPAPVEARPRAGATFRLGPLTVIRAPGRARPVGE
jgi:hexosaminidase